MSDQPTLAESMVGNLYGSLRVISVSGTRGWYALCRCDRCGHEKEHPAAQIRRRKAVGCAACGVKTGHPLKDCDWMIGRRFGKLRVTGFTYAKLYPADRAIQRLAVCECECGNVVNQRMYGLRDGTVVTCGNACPLRARRSPAEVALRPRLDQKKPVAICVCGTVGASPCRVCRMMSRVHLILRLGHSAGAASFVG